jgi:hypothetical protein
VLLLVETIDEAAETNMEQAKSLTPFPVSQQMDQEEGNAEEEALQSSLTTDIDDQEGNDAVNDSETVEHKNDGDVELPQTANGHQATVNTVDDISIRTGPLHEQVSLTPEQEEGANGAHVTMAARPLVPLDPELRGSQDWLLEDATPRRKDKVDERKYRGRVFVCLFVSDFSCFTFLQML